MTAKMTRAEENRVAKLNAIRRALCVEAEAFKHRLFAAGLHQSAHRMNKVTHAIGYEVAGQPIPPARRAK